MCQMLLNFYLKNNLYMSEKSCTFAGNSGFLRCRLHKKVKNN